MGWLCALVLNGLFIGFGLNPTFHQLLRFQLSVFSVIPCSSVFRLKAPAEITLFCFQFPDFAKTEALFNKNTGFVPTHQNLCSYRLEALMCGNKGANPWEQNLWTVGWIRYARCSEEVWAGYRIYTCTTQTSRCLVGIYIHCGGYICTARWQYIYSTVDLYVQYVGYIDICQDRFKCWIYWLILAYFEKLKAERILLWVLSAGTPMNRGLQRKLKAENGFDYFLLDGIKAIKRACSDLN